MTKNLAKSQIKEAVSWTGKYVDISKLEHNDGVLDIIDFNKYIKSGNSCKRVLINQDGSCFATSDNKGNLTLFYLNKCRFINISKNLQTQALVFIDKQGGLIAQALNNKAVDIYLLNNGKFLTSLKGHNYNVKEMIVNYRTNVLLTMSQDCCNLWDLNTFEKKKSLFGKNNSFSAVTFASNGECLITAFQDGTINFWEMSSFDVEDRVELPSNASITSLVCSNDCKYLIAGGRTPYIFIIDLKSTDSANRCTSAILPGRSNGAHRFNFLKDDLLAFLTEDDTFNVVDIKGANRVLMSIRLPNVKGIADYSIDRSNNLIVFASTSGEAYVYDFQVLLKIERMKLTKRINIGMPEDLVYTHMKSENMNNIFRETLAGSINKENFGVNTSRVPAGEEDHRTSEASYEEIHINSGQGEFSKSGAGKSLKYTQNNATTSRKKNIKASQTGNKFSASQPSLEVESVSENYLESSANPMSVPKLKSFLKKNKVFPEKHRGLIWKTLLQLPENLEAFENLLKKGNHTAFSDLHRRYPVSSEKLFTKLQKILSALAHYCPVFGEVDYFPAFVFPFVKLFSNDELLCFEILLTFLSNQAQHFFEFFPNPPINYLTAVEEAFRKHEPQIHSHFRNNGFVVTQYVWPILQAAFTDILPREEWLCFMDHLIANYDEPHYIIMFLVAYFGYFRESLLRIETIEELEIFIRKKNPIKLVRILDRADDLVRAMPKGSLSLAFKNNFPLTSNQYPILNFYPKFNVDHHKKLREEIAEEERRIEDRRRATDNLMILTDELIDREKKFKEKQELMSRAEQERRELLFTQEELRLKKKLEFDKQSRETRLEHLRKIESTVKNSLDHQEKLREEEFRTVDKEIAYRKKLDEFLLSSRLEEEMLQNLEFKSVQRLNETIDVRARDERLRRLNMDLDFRNKQKVLRDRMLEERWHMEDDELKLRREIMRQQKMSKLFMEEETNDRLTVENQIMLQEFERDLKIQEVERERKLRHLAEDAVMQNEEFMKLYRQQEKVLMNSDEQYLKDIMDREKQDIIVRAEERLRFLEEEKRLQAKEFEEHNSRIKEIAKSQNNKEFMQKIIEIKRLNQERLLEEEKNLQKVILEIEEERRLQKEMEQDLVFKERERIERDDFHKTLEYREKEILEEERARFDNFRGMLTQEMTKMEEIRRKMHEERLMELEKQREDEMVLKEEEIRARAQLENLKGYEEEIKNKQQQSIGQPREVSGYEATIKSSRNSSQHKIEGTGNSEMRNTTSNKKYSAQSSSSKYEGKPNSHKSDFSPYVMDKKMMTSSQDQLEEEEEDSKYGASEQKYQLKASGAGTMGGYTNSISSYSYSETMNGSAQSYKSRDVISNNPHAFKKHEFSMGKTSDNKEAIQTKAYARPGQSYKSYNAEATSFGEKNLGKSKQLGREEYSDLTSSPEQKIRIQQYNHTSQTSSHDDSEMEQSGKQEWMNANPTYRSTNNSPNRFEVSKDTRSLRESSRGETQSEEDVDEDENEYYQRH